MCSWSINHPLVQTNVSFFIWNYKHSGVLSMEHSFKMELFLWETCEDCSIFRPAIFSIIIVASHIVEPTQSLFFLLRRNTLFYSRTQRQYFRFLSFCWTNNKMKTKIALIKNPRRFLLFYKLLLLFYLLFFVFKLHSLVKIPAAQATSTVAFYVQPIHLSNDSSICRESVFFSYLY